MSDLRRILLPLHDLQRPSPAALRKAGALARASGAQLELFHALSEEQPARRPDSGRWGSSGQARSRALQRSLAVQRAERRLERIAKSASLRQCRVSCSVARDAPAYEAIVRRALASRADLVVAASQPHSLSERWLLRITDWELIRHCPCPLLFVKSPRTLPKPTVLVAVDPFHAHAKPAGLDARLLRVGTRFATLLGGAVHVFHAYMPLLTSVAGALGEPLIWESPEVEEVHRKQVRSELDRLAASVGIPGSRRHLAMGDAPTELALAARQLGADIVVMGAVSRSGLRRLLIGSTAEQTLDHLRCDVLIVKPRGFETTVPKALQKST